MAKVSVGKHLHKLHVINTRLNAMRVSSLISSCNPNMIIIFNLIILFLHGFQTTVGYQKDDCECGVMWIPDVPIKLQETFAGNHSWPWMVSIVNISDGDTVDYCGASLINDLYLITAAHCIPDMNNTGLEYFRLILGSNYINNESISDALIEKIITHEKFDIDTGDNDIALIKMDRQIRFNATISPICLMTEPGSLVNRVAKFTGWGSYNLTQPTEMVLKEDEGTVVSNEECGKNYSSVEIIITENMICCTPPHNDYALPCKGDSGGPLVIKGKETGHYSQIGIVSHGQGCGYVPNYPSIFTRLGNYIHWIQNNTRDGVYCKNSFESILNV